MGQLNTLYVVSDGYLSNCKKTFMPVVNGYWYMCTPTIVDKKTGKHDYFTYREGYTIPKEVRRRILEEDAEILLILKTFIRCQD